MVNIRPATAADVSAMIALEQALPAAAHYSREQYQQILTADAKRRIVVVAESGAELQGFAIARTIPPEWEIENVVVSPNVQRSGIATQLLRNLLNEAKRAGASSVLLEVRESNVPARGLYRKLGFSEEGCRRGYYHDPDEDAVLYGVDFT